MKPLYKGLIVALLHLLLVSSLGGKLLYDRWTQPRGWAKTAPIDPNLPIRGRYVRLRLELDVQGAEPWDGADRTMTRWTEPAILMVEDSRVVAVLGQTGNSTRVSLNWPEGADAPVARPSDVLAFFITEHIPDPSIRAEGEELWVEVTIPKKGPPRPIQLGVRKDGGEIVPLGLD